MPGEHLTSPDDDRFTQVHPVAVASKLRLWPRRDCCAPPRSAILRTRVRGQSVPAERVPLVVGSQLTEANQPPDLSRRREPPPDRGTLEWYTVVVGLDRRARLVTSSIRIRIPTGPTPLGSRTGPRNGAAQPAAPALGVDRGARLVSIGGGSDGPGGARRVRRRRHRDGGPNGGNRRRCIPAASASASRPARCRSATGPVLALVDAVEQ